MSNPLQALIAVVSLTLALPVSAQTLSGPALIHALQSGGYVIVMRHASSPQTPPAKDAAEPDNTNDERQLDAAGKESAKAMGEALRRLHIPVGEVFSSPTYRALETAKFAQLPTPKTAPELGEHGGNMAQSSEAQVKWLRDQATHLPSHTNTILITHYPNITAAFPQEATGIKDGEALVFRPDAKGGTTLVARIPIEDWPKLQP